MNNSFKNSLICVVGPTGVGKTALSIQLAKFFKTEIISADSRQFYKEMEIGTAKPSLKELSTVPHHFINSLSVADHYSAGDFEKDALKRIDSLFETKNNVILVGGSGLFVNAVCTGLDNLPKPAEGIREHLVETLQSQGIGYLQDRLKTVDPDYYQEVDTNNPQRIIRALEVYETTNTPFSEWRKKAMNLRNFNIISIGLNMPRESLYERINNRVDEMMSQGLLDEVTRLIPYRYKTPLISVGYTELFAYLDGQITLREAVNKIKQNTRRYAKRQLTWFKKNKDTVWFEPSEFDKIVDFLNSSTR